VDEIASALADSSRWRIVELLAERPRSVGELAEATGLRQPQTTKHLQTLARAGLVTVFPLGQRRVYAVESAPLAAFERRLGELVERIEAHADERDVIARYRDAIEAETAAADAARWADGRTFSFDRLLSAPREVVWRHWVDPERLASWWAVPSMAGRRLRARAAAGRARPARLPRRRGAALSLRGAGPRRAGARAPRLRPLGAGRGGRGLVRRPLRRQALRRLGRHPPAPRPGITDTTVEAVPYIAGIATGWSQVLNNLAAQTKGTT
jgi:DNA-binding transcriptional ArsR family regulator